MNLKERAIATHRAIITDQQTEQDRIDNERRERIAAVLNESIGEDLFFVPGDDLAEIVHTQYVRNILHGDIRTITTTYDVVTDGSVDIGVKRGDEEHPSYVLLTPCATPGCDQHLTPSLYGLSGEDEDERFANLVMALGRALAYADGQLCGRCQMRPCPTCGHVR